MSFFSNNRDNYEEGVGNTKSNGAKWFVIAGLLAILFAPVTAFFYLCYNRMFKRMRMRPHLPIGLSIIVSGFFAWLLVSQELYKPKFFDEAFPTGFSFSEIGNITSVSLLDVLFYFLTVLWVTGFAVSFVPVALTIFSSVMFMKRNPAYKEIEGEWAYKWEYARTPLEWLRRKKRIENIKEGKVKFPDRAVLGLSADYETRDEHVARHNKEALQHMFIVGASGSGKTMTTLAMIKSDIENGIPVAVADFKRSDELAIKMATWAHEYNRPFYHFLDCEPEDYNIPYSESPSVYNPFANAGNAIPDMLLGMRQYDTASDVYKKSVSELTQAIHKMIRITNRKYLFLDGVNGKKPAIPWEKGDIYVWLKAMENINVLHHGYSQTLKEKGIETDSQMAKVVAATQKPSTQMNIAMNSVRGQLLTLVNSAYGQWFDETSPYPKINLFDNMAEDSQGAVTLFSFSSDKQKDFSKSFGALLFQDLTNVSSNRRESGLQNDVHVYADEFQVVNPDCITGLIEKARSSRMGMTFISQSLMQIVKEAEFNGEAVLRSILDSCSNYIAHNGSNQESATILAEIIGKKPVTRYSIQKETSSALFAIKWFNRRKGRIATQYDDDWVCSPNRFTSLKQPRQNKKGEWLPGEAILINRAPNGIETDYALARKIELFLDNEVTAPVQGSLSKVTPTTETEENVLALEIEDDINENNNYNVNTDYRAHNVINNEYNVDTENHAPNDNKYGNFVFEDIEDSDDENNDLNDSKFIVERKNVNPRRKVGLADNAGKSSPNRQRKSPINQNRGKKVDSRDKNSSTDKFDLEEVMFSTTSQVKDTISTSKNAPVKNANKGQSNSVSPKRRGLPVNRGGNVSNVDSSPEKEIVESHDDILKKKQQMLDRFK